jgi:hypothetical protein
MGWLLNACGHDTNVCAGRTSIRVQGMANRPPNGGVINTTPGHPARQMQSHTLLVDRAASFQRDPIIRDRPKTAGLLCY